MNIFKFSNAQPLFFYLFLYYFKAVYLANAHFFTFFFVKFKKKHFSNRIKKAEKFCKFCDIRPSNFAFFAHTCSNN
jgi:hypothetical protein